MGSGLIGKEDQESHDGIKTSSSFHPCPSMDYAQFSIQGAVGVYSIYLGIDCSGTSIDGIYSTNSIYSTDGIYSIGS
ncbi:hypothetical protein COCNU_01G013090 [Cocos nucifera]|uniref:Uncharacterized protein n=1 Tax=Cocos nucifera TaxID=13894 RepID=A0A8K0HVM6_COCNU|nr:hypothetical protein COCNU_01G013090 [Cocos nucifera]